MVPAVAVADELRDQGAEVSFLGARGRLEADLVPEAGYEIDLFDLAGIDRRNPVKAVKAAVMAASAVPKIRKILKQREADVVMGGGGFVAGPAGLGARSLKIPLVLTEADRHLGLANRMLARRADRVCLAFEIEGRTGESYLVTGRPVNRAVLEADRGKARHRFGIDQSAKCLLVMGGSLGARSVNLSAMVAFAERPGRDFDVIHVSGKRDYGDLRERLDGATHSERYTLLEYEPNMGDALAACDLVLGRSGGSVFELTARGRPAVLVPYPYATGDHQSANAAWMVDAGAAEVIADQDLSADLITQSVGRIFGDPEALARMAAASRTLAKPTAARDIAAEILKTVEARA